jgi:predicted dehydrogenase/threonine dehydrogenase-like Zn-dependent dehydrogenase
MRQILQDLRAGQIEVADVPCPAVGPGHLLVQTACSLISSGTERMLLEFGRAGYLAKARQQPEKVKQVFDKIRTDGLLQTVQAVMSKLDQAVPLGYCNVGRVLAVGPGVTEFAVGDRVVSNGHHAEVVLVPKHLAARIPDTVSDEEAAFTVVGSIALQGIRLIAPTLGETIAVFGLGLIGLLAVQVLKAHGARVLGFDFDQHRVDLARQFGADAENLASGADPLAAARARTEELGVDGVLVTAATDSDQLMHQAAQMCRKRGRIVLTGVTGLNLQRSDFYEKELTFQVSCSYGPGRYDATYEEQGHDYPAGYVRWTEQRNFQAILGLLREKRLATEHLISQRISLAEAPRAYEAILDKTAIGVVLTYPQPQTEPARRALTARVVCHHEPRGGPASAVFGVIGAGSFCQQKILPALAKTGARLKWVSSSTGLSGSQAARKFGIEQSTTDNRLVLDDAEVTAVVIATRHNSHAQLVVQALKARKSVFVEKPLCLSETELNQVQEAYALACQSAEKAPILMVGFNRRFAPLVQVLQTQLSGRQQPLSMIYTCNAGAIPSSHWTQDPSLGGGRILGEACHFIDLLHFLAGQSPIVQVAGLEHGVDGPANPGDTVSITLRMADGSLGQINYFANGSPSYPKERLEVFSEGRVLQLDNFRRLEIFGPRAKTYRRWRQDKGHQEELQRFVAAVREGGSSPIGFPSLVNTAQATLAAVTAIRQQSVVSLPGIG